MFALQVNAELRDRKTLTSLVSTDVLFARRNGISWSMVQIVLMRQEQGNGNYLLYAKQSIT